MLTKARAASSGAMLTVLFVIGIGVGPIRAQSGGTPVPEPPSIDQSWPDVNLNVVVLDKNGAPQNIDEHQFHLFEDGVEQPLRFRGSPDSPVSLALIIDSSGSIYKHKPAIVAAVTAIVKALPPDSEVTAVLFANYAFLDLPLTPVSQVSFSFLDHLDTRGGTTLYDTVVATEKYFIPRAKYVRRAMVILSDGEDNASHVSMAAAFGSMEQPGSPMVYVCPPSTANFFQTQKMVGLITMSGLAKWGGGVGFNLDPDPAAAAAQVSAAIRGQYVLQFTAAHPERNGKKHKLKLLLPEKGLEIRALPQYFAPSPSSQ